MSIRDTVEEEIPETLEGVLEGQLPSQFEVDTIGVSEGRLGDTSGILVSGSIEEGVGFVVDYEIGDGIIDVSGEMRGSLSMGPAQAITILDPTGISPDFENTVELVYQLDAGGLTEERFKNRLESAITRGLDVADADPLVSRLIAEELSSFPTGITASAPYNLRTEINAIFIPTDSEFELISQGETPIQFDITDVTNVQGLDVKAVTSGSIRYPVIFVPDPSVLGGNVEGDVDPLETMLENLPTLNFSITMKPTSAIRSFVSGAVAQNPSISIEIPPEDYVSVVSIELPDCLTLPEAELLRDYINSVERAGSAVQNIEDLRDILNDINSLSVEDSNRVLDRVASIAENPLDETRKIRGDDIQSLIQAGVVDGERVREWQVTIEESIQSASFRGRELTVHNLRQLERRARNGINNVEGRCEINLEESLIEARNQLDSFISQLETLNTLIDRLELITNIQVGDAERRARGDAIPCAQRFSEVDQEISELEESVNQVSVGASENVVQDLINQRESVVTTIENQVDDPECVERFTRRIESTSDNIRIIQDPVKIAQEVRQEARAQRQEQIQRLRGRVEELRQRQEQFIQDAQ